LIKKVLIKVLLISFSGLFSLQTLAKEAPLSVGWELWYPYQYHNEQQQLVGLDFEILNAILKKANLSANFTEMPWKRHLHYIKNGDMDLAMGSSLTKERQAYALFSLPYRNETVKLFVKKDDVDKIELTHLSDLINSPYIIGVEGGYYYGKIYQELIKRPEFKSHISEVLDIEQSVQQLMKGYTDGFLVDPVTMKAFVNKYKIDGEMVQHDIEIYSDDIFMMISKKSSHHELLAKINQAISQLKQTGEIKEIINRWSELQKANSNQ